MRKARQILFVVLITIVAVWISLTAWVEVTGPAVLFRVNAESIGPQAIVVFDPDPIYNLDEQVCASFAQGLADGGFRVTVASVGATEAVNVKSFDLVVVCSNTYNWRPDFAITGFVKNHAPWDGRKMVAITLGSGSTTGSQRYFEKLILKSGASLIDSKAFWLMRPNDESRMNEPNTKVACDMAYTWARHVARLVN